MDECKPLVRGRLAAEVKVAAHDKRLQDAAGRQGLTLVHISA